MTSERPTADIVTDLRTNRTEQHSYSKGQPMVTTYTVPSALELEAADRLEHFETYARMLEVLASELDSLRPSCSTCDGTMKVLGVRCTNCHDGKMSFKQVVDEWKSLKK